MAHMPDDPEQGFLQGMNPGFGRSPNIMVASRTDTFTSTPTSAQVANANAVPPVCATPVGGQYGAPGPAPSMPMPPRGAWAPRPPAPPPINHEAMVQIMQEQQRIKKIASTE